MLRNWESIGTYCKGTDAGYCESNGGLNKLHGFILSRSAMYNLLTTSHHIADAINVHRPIDIIAFDFLRAFGKVSHELLVKELFKNSFGSKALRWVESFLWDRSEVVRVAGVLS